MTRQTIGKKIIKNRRGPKSRLLLLTPTLGKKLGAQRLTPPLFRLLRIGFHHDRANLVVVFLLFNLSSWSHFSESGMKWGKKKREMKWREEGQSYKLGAAIFPLSR